MDLYKYFFEIPLYQKVKLHQKYNYRIKEFNELITRNVSINAYNPDLEDNTTYHITTLPETEPLRLYGPYDDAFREASQYYEHKLFCVRTEKVFMVYSHFDNDNTIFQKIGQFKSIADFHISKIKRYKSVLSEEKLKEFTRAAGLAANGVGVGSFIYLRRIFETLLQEAHAKAKEDSEWNDKDYETSRVSHKIKMLKNYLPDFVVENKGLYGILSKGVHSLSEDECLAYYDTVRSGIEIILDSKLEESEKKRKIEKAEKEIAALQAKLK